MKLFFACPIDGAKFSAIERMSVATQVLKRKCRRCGRWYQLVVEPLGDRRIDGGVAHFTKATIMQIESKITTIE